jgi:serine/threonine-protein kinase
MGRVDADRNLLFGVLALQNGFITREQLIASVSTWVLDKSRPLDALLREQGALGPEDHAILEPLVRRHLAGHGGDPARSLAAISSVGSAREALAEIRDEDVQASLRGVGQMNEGVDGISTLSFPAEGGRAHGARYVILREIAEGGLGLVSVALDRELHRRVAFKEIKADAAHDAVSRARFLVEAEITGRMEHPGIVPVYSLGHAADGRPYYAMRFVEGDNLEQAIRRFHDPARGPKAPGEREVAFRALLRRFLDVCNAVAFAHRKGVLHRDIKPGNILLGDYGETLVVDWGLAKALGRPGPDATPDDRPVEPSAPAAGSYHTMAGSFLGTPGYASPEAADGKLDQLGPPSDVYSLGATLYQLLTGRGPFSDSETGERIQKTIRGEFPPPRQVKPDVPRPLEAICLRAMALGPADRYATPRALVKDIESWLADEPVSAWPEPWGVRTRRWMRRHRLMVACLITGFLTASGGILAVQRVRAQRERQRQLVSTYRTTAETLVRLLEETTAPPDLPRDQATPLSSEAGPGIDSARLDTVRLDPAWLEPLRTRYDEMIRRLEASGQQEQAREVRESFRRINARFRRIDPNISNYSDQPQIGLGGGIFPNPVPMIGD